ncbi:hypothetical protein J3L16_09505 [Alteromonas sp. 5E99-2]|uniref:heme biosynthesis HemY N-terminal domain-containing protein n=1 Tax=Alteromonas sp. 5E99-2 TaxID=2817683 RepID=UPI001A99D964|nr:heme biosynthesis HemY N-terminal domain-containing protein [Alteromonas sp. 5E99-2]MBO1255918.1 hypothetical protein [Alteromonas sp. 5E99-2]
MKRLVKYLLYIAVFLLVLFIAPLLVGEKGYVLIAFGQRTIELTVVALGVIIFGLVIIGIIALKLISILLSASRTTSRWFTSGGAIKREQSFYNGLFALAYGNTEKAKAAFENVNKDEFHGFHHLALGQIALQNGKSDVATMWFDKAKNNTDKNCADAAFLMQAQQCLTDGKIKLAVESLDGIKDAEQADVIRLKAKAMAMNNQWSELESALPKWRKQLGSDYSGYTEEIATQKFAEIASKEGALQLKDYWNGLSRTQRNDDVFRISFIQQLISQGLHQDAQKFLLDWYKKKTMPYGMISIIKTLRTPHPADLIGLLERSIKLTPEEPSYYAALGHIAYNSGDIALSERALIKAIDLKETSEELILLSKIYEESNAYEQAMQSMRRVHALQS